MRRERFPIAGLQGPRPAPEGRRAGAAQPGAPLGAAHAGRVHTLARRGAVVVHEDHEGVAVYAPVLELCEHPADVLVDVVDHAEEMRELRRGHFALVERGVLRFGGVGAVRGIGGNIGEKRLPGPPLRVHPRGSLTEKHVGAKAAGLFELPVVQNDGVEIRVAGRVAAGAGIDLPDATAAVDEHFVEPARVGQILLFVAEVPLAEDARGVARVAEHLGQRGGSQGQSFALQDRVCDPVLELVPPGEQGAAGRRAGRADMEVHEPHTIGVQPIEVRRPEDGVAVGREVAVALVVGEDEEDVGSARRGGGGRERRQQDDWSGGEPQEGGSEGGSEGEAHGGKERRNGRIGRVRSEVSQKRIVFVRYICSGGSKRTRAAVPSGW